MNMPFTRPILDANTKVDFYAGNLVALHNLLPVWGALPEERRGVFYAWENREEIQVDTFNNYLPGSNPLVITNLKDLNTVFYCGEERAFVFSEFEHEKQTRGLLATVSLFLSKNKKDADRRKVYAEKYQQASQFSTPEEFVSILEKFIVGIAPKHQSMMGHDSVGLIYMAFGDKARMAVKRSVATLRRVGFSYPVCVVGDAPVDGFEFRLWEGESPFDPTQKKNFMFRAGRVKPFLYSLSPFDRTLYVDADTEFLKDIADGFKLLDKSDIAITQEYLTVGELYNKFMAGWEINIEERAQTIEEGVAENAPFINSGVIFFRKSDSNNLLFSDWNKEWMRFQQWDEQLALMRALNKSKSVKKYLGPLWNDPHVHDDTIIFHNYGRGSVRENV